MSYGYLVIGDQKIEIETWRYVRHVPSGKDYVVYVPTRPPRAPAWQPREFVRGILPTTGRHAVIAVQIPANCVAVAAATLPNLAARPSGATANRTSPTGQGAPTAIRTAKLGNHSNQLWRVCRAIESVLGLPKSTENTLPYFKQLLHQANQQVFSDLVFDHESYGYVVRYSKAESERLIHDVQRLSG